MYAMEFYDLIGSEELEGIHRKLFDAGFLTGLKLKTE